ncbi:MAG TPA: aminotransferase class V-fold PLP-dependent enzyme, partial [Chiayiivirga sp.]|nr:aminotransferase class V-fold PLP-dependent enzyme [Chiayiivirga sp.]
MMRIPYFDYAASTPTDPRIVTAMVALLGPQGDFANPSSTLHAPGRAAAARVEAARAQVASLLRADPREIVFTSGATEA